MAAMADYWIWWTLAAVLVGAELMTGTFYLLAVGVAFRRRRPRGTSWRVRCPCSSSSAAC